jgi:uncharacterized membrane protein YccC
MSFPNLSLQSLRDPARQAVQTTAAAVLTFAVMKLLGLPHVTWAVISALFVVQSSVGGTVASMIGRIEGAALGTVIGLGCLYLIGSQGWWAALALAVAVTIVAFIVALRPGLRYGHVTAGILIISGSAGDGAIMAGFERALAIGIGAVLAAAVALLIFPEPAHKKANRHLAQALRRCGDLLSAALAGLMDEKAFKLQPMHDDIRRHVEKAAGAAGASRRSRFHGRSGPPYSRLIHSVQRLWSTLIIIDRVDAEPLPEAARRQLGPALEALSNEACSYFQKLGNSIESNEAPPRPQAMRDKLDALDKSLDAFRRQDDSLPSSTAERVFSLAFGLEELARNFDEVGHLFSDGGREPQPEPSETRRASSAGLGPRELAEDRGAA